LGCSPCLFNEIGFVLKKIAYEGHPLWVKLRVNYFEVFPRGGELQKVYFPYCSKAVNGKMDFNIKKVGTPRLL